MRVKAGYNFLRKWIKTAEYLLKPEKQLMGRWRLKEFYTEPGSTLLHYKEEQVEKEDLVFNIEFLQNQMVIHKVNLNLPFHAETGTFQLDVSRNYIILYHNGHPEQSIIFQFALTNGILKLLKKDKKGRIQFFGFFTNQQD